MKDSAARFQPSCLYSKRGPSKRAQEVCNQVAQQDGRSEPPDDWTGDMVLGVCCSVPCKGVELNCLTPAVPAEVLDPLVAAFMELALRNCASQASL